MSYHLKKRLSSHAKNMLGNNGYVSTDEQGQISFNVKTKEIFPKLGIKRANTDQVKINIKSTMRSY